HHRAIPHRHHHAPRADAAHGRGRPDRQGGHLREKAQEATQAMNKRETVAANFDRSILVMYLMLMFMGWANIYSAAYDPDHASILDQGKEYGKQAVWMGISLVLGACILMIRGKLIRESAYYIYAFVALLLASV